jgi:hypothetical protein
MQRIGITLGTLASLTMFLGCESSHTASISVELHNESQQAVTAWITKTGVRDAEWLAPEDLAMSAKPESINGVVIPPGKTGEMGPMKGKFEGESVPVLRVYAGQLEYDQLLATSVNSGLRVDVTLSDGMNRLKVVKGAKLDVVPAGAR